MDVFIHYMILGFQHVIPLGFDHILFITALFFLNSKIKTAVIQCSLFTMAHSLTLASVALGFLQINSRLVEVVIAFSIFLVALENLFESGLKPWRLVLVFALGLVHGMGFASSLQQIGIPQSDFISALFGFNVGVEFAQIAIIMCCYFGLAKWFASADWYKVKVVRPISLAIAGIGLFWSIERFLY